MISLMTDSDYSTITCELEDPKSRRYSRCSHERSQSLPATSKTPEKKEKSLLESFTGSFKNLLGLAENIETQSQVSTSSMKRNVN